MNELARKVATAREHVSSNWTDGRARGVYAAMLIRRRRRRVGTMVASSAALAFVLVTVLGVLREKHGPRFASQVSNPAGPLNALQLGDGATVSPRDAASSVVLREVSLEKTLVELEAGGARLAVAGSSKRVVRLEAGNVFVEASEGLVDVAREGESLRVSVVSGHALVLWGLEESVLQEGQFGEFPVRATASASASASAAAATSPVLSEPASPEAPSSSTAPLTPATPAAAGRWRTQAQDGDYDGAFRALQAAGPTAVRDETGDLLLAADVARLSKHPSDAVGPLQRVLRDHTDDPRAPLAAFTLGRVLLDELGRPVDAASAFAQARTLAPGGPLEEDALAREVEAWSRAGNASRAHTAADTYISRYPDGRRIRAVRKFGGME